MVSHLLRAAARFGLAGVLALGAGAFSGCKIQWVNPNGSSSSSSPPKYRGPECKNPSSIQREDERLATQLICGGDNLFGYHVDVGMRIEKMHSTFDDRRFDHLSAGI